MGRRLYCFLILGGFILTLAVIGGSLIGPSSELLETKQNLVKQTYAF